MGDFRTWLEAIESNRIASVDDARRLSSSSGLDSAGLDFDLIEKALSEQVPVIYDEAFQITHLGPLPAANKDKVLRMMGAFAQKLGVDAPDTLEQAQALKVRGPDFRRMTPPIIVQKTGGRILVADGVSRINAAKLLSVPQLRAFVIGGGK